MQLRIGEFSFQPSPLLSLGAACLLVLLLSLGNWQLKRADEKRTIMQDYEQRVKQPPSELLFPLEDVEQWRSRKVRVTGRFDNEKQFLLDNQVSRGQVGLQVLTPLKLSNRDLVVLVDRGWLPLGPDREQLPDVKVNTGIVSLIGTVYVPYKEGYRLGGMDEGQSGWPRLIQFLDFNTISNRLGLHVAPLTIRLDPNLPHGYRREWQTVSMSPETHLAYALQWFTLAAVLIVIYLALSLKKLSYNK